jgi:hypothetical protein
MNSAGSIRIIFHRISVNAWMPTIEIEVEILQLNFSTSKTH